MKRFLVTGGAGFIGRHLVNRLLESGSQVRVLDNFITGTRERFPSPVDVVEGDAVDAKIVARCLREIDGVFHLAAIPSVKIAQEDPLLVMRCGEMALVNVLQECLKTPSIKRLVFASSAAVYGNPKFLPITEDHPTNPISNYGVGKLACEHYLRAVCANQQNLDIVSLRFFNVFGMGQMDDNSYAGVITKFVSAIRCGRRPIIYGNGKQTRDFIPVQIVVKALRDFMKYEKFFLGQAINVGTGVETSIIDIVKLICSILDSEIKPIFEPVDKSNIIKSCADISMLKTISSFEDLRIDMRSYLTQLT